MIEPFEKRISSYDEMIAWGQCFGKTLPKGAVLAFFGELGAGKTTLIKGILASILKIDPSHIVSPTFNYLNVYTSEELKKVSHFDLYRLTNAHAFTNAGFEEYLYDMDFCCIEWSERIVSLLPSNTFHIHIDSLSDTERLVKGTAS